jgi:hypothetical protein
LLSDDRQWKHPLGVEATSRHARQRCERVKTRGTGGKWNLFGRPLLVHYHIYKNAGSSVEHNLLESFREKWAIYEGTPESFSLSSHDIAAFAKANPGICAISSHKARPFQAPRRFFPILFLRHPIDRARSIYHFTKRDPVQFDHVLARDNSFADYVNWWLDRPSSPLRNYQVIHLSQVSLRLADASKAVASPKDLQEACNLLSSLHFFGVVRRYQDSCIGFHACYGRMFPGLRMRFVRENASTDELPSETGALNVARDELGEATHARLVEANRLDLALYERALHLFDRNMVRISQRGLRRACRSFVDLCWGKRGGRRPLRRRAAES